MLLVIGDSHTLIWGGRLLGDASAGSRFPLVKIHHLADALAYNLMNDTGEAGKWGTKILSLLAAHSADLTAIMLSFGEIDIRTQIVRRAIADGLALEESVARVVERYIAFVDLLRKETAVPVFLWGPVPSASDFGDWNPLYPNCGSEQDRNVATELFNKRLEEQSRKRKGVYAFHVSKTFMAADWRTEKSYFADGCHLGLNALDIIMRAFNAVVAENKLNLPDYFNELFALGSGKPRVRDIAASARVAAISSVGEGEHPTRIDNPGDKQHFVFHTGKDDAPFIRLDLGYGAMLFNLVIYNRFDAHKERARSLEVLTGLEPSDLTLVYRHEGETFGLNGAPLEIRMERGKPVRYILLRLREKEYFHLGKIMILAESFV